MITEWKPISKPQEQFLSLPETIREGFFGGAAGPGKSECLMMYPIVRQYYKHPRFKALFMRRTYSELKLEIIPRSKELYEAFGGRYNKGDLVWDFSDEGGGLVIFGHCEHEDDVHKYDSMEINLFLPDELESFLEYQYLYIAFTRVRTSTPELPAIVRAAGMPGGIGHTWVKRRFIDPEVKGGKVIVGKGNNKRIYIHSTLADNPKIDKNYSNALEALPDAEKRAKKYGDWNSYEGQVFEEFRDRRYPDEPENALHVIPPFDIPEWWPRIMVIDWGYHAMTWVGYGAVSPNRRLFVYREQHWKETKIAEWVPYVKEYVDREDVKVIKVCKSAGQDRGQEHTIQQQISEHLERGVELVNANTGTRVAGKQLLHEYLRWKPKYNPGTKLEPYDEARALYILRNKGELEFKKYVASYDSPEDEKNLPRMQIFENCPLLIEAIKSAIYDKTNTEDVAQWEGDDPYDGIRYLVDSADRFFTEAEDEFAKVEARDNMISQFKEHQDWNLLYRQARIIEGKNYNSTRPVRRFRAR